MRDRVRNRHKRAPQGAQRASFRLRGHARGAGSADGPRVAHGHPQPGGDVPEPPRHALLGHVQVRPRSSRQADFDDHARRTGVRHRPQGLDEDTRRRARRGAQRGRLDLLPLLYAARDDGDGSERRHVPRDGDGRGGRRQSPRARDGSSAPREGPARGRPVRGDRGESVRTPRARPLQEHRALQLRVRHRGRDSGEVPRQARDAARQRPPHRAPLHVPRDQRHLQPDGELLPLHRHRQGRQGDVHPQAPLAVLARDPRAPQDRRGGDPRREPAATASRRRT